MEDKLKENEEYKIIKYEIKMHGEKKKYIIDVKNNNNEIYNNIISNEYLENLLNKLLDNKKDNILDNSPFIKMKTLKLSSNNKTKKKLLDIIIDINEDYINNLNDLNISKIEEGKYILNSMKK